MADCSVLLQLFGKMFAEVCAESGEGENQFVKWETYLFFVLFVGFNFGMEYWRQKALNLFSTMYCVPLFQVSLVIFSVSSPDPNPNPSEFP